MDSFQEIYRDSARKVYRFLLRLGGDADLAEELTAETFYQAFLHIDAFRGSVPSTPGCARSRKTPITGR